MATFDDHVNLGAWTVATAPTPATSGTALVKSGTATAPSVPFNVIIYPSGSEPTTANAEIARVTSTGSGDDWTITRGQEGTAARSIVAGDLIANAPTDKVFTDIESAIVVVSTALSNEVSVRAAADAALSQGLSVVSQALSVETAARVASGNALSNAISVVSNAISVVSQAVSVVSTAASHALSVAAAASILAVAADTHAATASAAATSVDSRVNALSNQHSVLSQAHSALSVNVQTVSNAASHALSVANAASNAASVVSQALSVRDAALSVRIDTASNAASIVSQSLSVANAALSNLISAHNALSNRVSANSGTGGSGSVTSNELSAAGASLAARIDTVSNLVSALTSSHNALSNQVSNILSAGLVSTTSNELSVLLATVSAQAASALSDAVSVGNVNASALSNAISALTSAHNALSNVVSNIISAGGGGVSVTSNELSIALAAISAQANSANVSLAIAFVDLNSNTISLLADFISNEASNRVSADNALSTTISNLNSVVSTEFSRSQQTYRNGSVYVISANTLSDVPGLSISMAASTMYQIEGALMYECGTSGGFAFGMSLPALAGAGSYVEMWAQATEVQAGAVGAATTDAAGRAAFSAEAAGQTIIASVTMATINVLRRLRINGMICTSAAGTAQLMAKSSVAGASMSVRGGYLKAYRIGTI